MNKETIARQLQQYGCLVSLDEPMSAHTSFRIGGPADVFVSATAEQMKKAICFCRENDVPMLVIGNGSNLLVSDGGVEGVVLQPSEQGAAFEEEFVIASAGMSLGKLCLQACEHGLSGLEFAYGIPGSVGGGVYMNAGAYGGELADVLVEVTALDENGNVLVLDKEELKLGYRRSVFMERPLTVLKATFRLKADSPAAIRARMDDFLSRRKDKQPLEYPSGGSFFKRPAGYFAGALIEQCGLKGFTVGGAQVSEKHAGFVINRGGATCADVMELCRQVQERVWHAFGVKLEREVQYIGK